VPLGASLVVIAIALFASAVSKFRAALRRSGAQAHHRHRPYRPYRFSRNSIYLAFSLLQLGIAIWGNSVWLLATLGVPVTLMRYVVIPREEQCLERRFGSQYLEYKASVRRSL
jgi:protein-S-isoprenylcysteine O-methyltransferase Ste14